MADDRAWAPPVSDRAVAEKTGRTWAEWIAVLDARGCATLSHKEIVAVVAGEGIGAWWQQSVTVGYERARGLRDLHQTSSGYRTNVSKTMRAPLATLWRAWTDDVTRERWLPDHFEIRKANPERSLRITWNDGTNLEVLVTRKDASRSHVALEHGKLGSADRVEELRAFWRDRLDRLRALLEAE